MEQVHIYKTECVPFEEFEELRSECQIFVEEVTQRRLLLHAAHIKLLDLHSRIRLIMSWCLSNLVIGKVN
jgi:hypothetical protein